MLLEAVNFFSICTDLFFSKEKNSMIKEAKDNLFGCHLTNRTHIWDTG